jgi:hypothetical protein
MLPEVEYWRGERYIPKNVFFLREEVLIYDAPESTMHPRALHSQECFLPPRGGFNLRCTQSPSKSLKDWAQCLRQLNFKNRLLPTGITISFIRSLGPSPRRKVVHSGSHAILSQPSFSC